MNNNDRSLRCDRAIRAIADGDRSALSIIYDEMARTIYFAAYAVTANHADAEDALQETMVQIVKYAPTYREGTSACAFILTIARHRAIDIVRRRKQTVPMEEAAFTEAAEREEPFSQMEALSLLSPLPHDDRQLVIFRLYDELSYEEIAQIMAISVSAAQKRYQRALKKLQKQYAKERSCQHE